MCKCDFWKGIQLLVLYSLHWREIGLCTHFGASWLHQSPTGALAPFFHPIFLLSVDYNYRPCTFTGQKSSEIRYWGTNSLFTNFQLIWSKFLYVIGEYSLFANPLFANFLHMIKRAFQVDLRDRPLFANIRYSRIRYSRTSLYHKLRLDNW